MRSWKEALEGSWKVLLAGSWAVVRVADRVRRRGRYKCMFIQFGSLGVAAVDMMVGRMMRYRGS